MTPKPIRVSVSAPTGPLPSGQGFYQLEEDILYVQVGSFSRRRVFFSYLESDGVRFDIDRKGELIFIEVGTPRRKWKIDPKLSCPAVVESADIRFLDFRKTIPEPTMVTSKDRSMLSLGFSPIRATSGYSIAQNIIVQIDDRNHLASIWITDIVDDQAGQELAAFRKQQRKLGHRLTSQGFRR